MIATGLSILLFAAIAGLLLTSQSQQAASQHPGKGAPWRRFLVDEEPVLTARALARFADTPDERVNAEESLQSADDEVEVAFAAALRDAQEHPVALTAEAKALAERVDRSDATVAADQAKVDALTKQLAGARDEQKPSIQSQLEIAQAQSELDRDMLQDAKQDLARAGGNPGRSIHELQRQMERHKLFEQHGLEASAGAADTADAGYDASNLIAQASAWFALSRKAALLRRAIDGAAQMYESLTQMHELLEQQVEQASQAARPETSKPRAPRSPSFRIDPQALGDLTKRMGDEQDLREAYSEWLESVMARQAVARRGIIRSFLWIMLIIPSVFLAGRTGAYALARASRKRPHLTHADAVLWFAVQAAGVLLVLVVILGFPQHVPEAIFGVVGAGLTVALKDFSGRYVDDRIRGILGGSGKEAAAGE